jgi:YgiT-type zinc finger domain-containing protein
MNDEITCSICGQITAREVRRTKIVGTGEHQVFAENVPMISCRHCGHDYFSLAVAKMLDQIRATPQQQAIHKSFAVVELAA